MTSRPFFAPSGISVPTHPRTPILVVDELQRTGGKEGSHGGHLRAHFVDGSSRLRAELRVLPLQRRNRLPAQRVPYKCSRQTR